MILKGRHLFKVVIKVPSVQGGKNAEQVQMVNKGSLDTNKVIKC